MSWTPEREAKMRELWGQGMSASAVAAQLGPWCTRSAVLGKVHRLGLSDRAAAAAPPRSLVPPASKPVAPAAITDAFYAQQKQPKPKMGRQLPLRQEEVAKPVQAPVLIVDDEAVIPISARVTLMDLRESSCRWPMGDPQSDEFRFCGGKAVIGGGPYCAYHARVAYVPMAARRKQFSNEPRANMRASHVKRGSTAWGDG